MNNAQIAECEAAIAAADSSHLLDDFPLETLDSNLFNSHYASKVAMSRKLKQQFIDAKRGVGFLERIATVQADPPDYVDLFPSNYQHTDLEEDAGMRVNMLKAAKKECAELQEQASSAAAKYAIEEERLEAAKTRVALLLKGKRVADQLRQVRAARGNDDAIEKMANDPELMAGPARTLNDAVASDNYEMRNTLSAAGPRLNELRADLEEMHERVKMLQSEKEKLMKQEASDETEDPLVLERRKVRSRLEARHAINGMLSVSSMDTSS